MTAKAAYRFAHAVVALVALGTASIALAPAASADDLIVKYDQSQLLRVPRPIAEIIIGNPSIADVTVQASNMLVVTGKTFGTTNVIVLDADRNVIQDQRIVVIRDPARQVSLYKGTKRETYSCAPACNPALVAATTPSTSARSRPASRARRNSPTPRPTAPAAARTDRTSAIVGGLLDLDLDERDVVVGRIDHVVLDALAAIVRHVLRSAARPARCRRAPRASAPRP